MWCRTLMYRLVPIFIMLILRRTILQCCTTCTFSFHVLWLRMSKSFAVRSLCVSLVGTEPIVEWVYWLNCPDFILFFNGAHNWLRRLHSGYYLSRGKFACWTEFDVWPKLGLFLQNSLPSMFLICKMLAFCLLQCLKNCLYQLTFRIYKLLWWTWKCSYMFSRSWWRTGRWSLAGCTF
jgi:hypothetical protein